MCCRFLVPITFLFFPSPIFLYHHKPSSPCWEEQSPSAAHKGFQRHSNSSSTSLQHCLPLQTRNMSSLIFFFHSHHFYQYHIATKFIRLPASQFTDL
ncbi:hypothetical protein AAHC03_05215 [Spirometra sp. Aus1]